MPASIFSGTKVKLLKKIMSLNGGAEVVSSTTDPTVSAVSAPKGSLLLNENTGQLFRKLDAGSSTNWALASSGGTGVNLMEMDSNFQQTKKTNSDAEISVGDWVPYADAAATMPVDMTGGSPNTTIARSTSSPLNGAAHFLMTINSGASRQGEGVSCVVNVPPAYRNKTLVLKAPFSIGGAGAVVEDDFRIFAYDVTNGRLITPFTVGNIIGSSGLLVAQIPVGAASQIRVGIHIARTTDAANTIAFDDVTLGLESVPAGMAGSDWTRDDTLITPVNFGTVSFLSARRRRVGDSMEIEGFFKTGTTSAAVGRLDINGYRIDTNKKLANGDTDRVNYAGEAIRLTSAGGREDFDLYWQADDDNSIYINNAAASSTFQESFTNQVGDASGFAFRIVIPISGWSSNVSMGESSSFLISSYLANGTRVTGSAPTKLGEYRSYLKNAGASTFTETNGTPNTLPSASNGLLVYNGAAYNSGDSANEPTKYEIFVGKNKQVKSVWYQSSGRTGFIDARPYEESSSVSTGYFENYDPTTGIYTVVANRYLGGTSNHKSGYTGDGVTTANDVYFDLVVSENALAVGSQLPRSEVWVTNGNGFGSTATKIRRFSTTRTNIGTAITYADSASNGATFTINESGVYAVYASDSGAGAVQLGITVNSAALTTNVGTISDSTVVAYVRTPSADRGAVSTTLNLNAGDVVRHHTDATGNATDNFLMFRITKVSN